MTTGLAKALIRPGISIDLIVVLNDNEMSISRNVGPFLLSQSDHDRSSQPVPGRDGLSKPSEIGKSVPVLPNRRKNP
jgi:hypothetical protein